MRLNGLARLTRSQRIAAAALAVVALGLITLDLGGGGLASAHSGVRGAMGSLYRGTDSVLGPVRRFAQGVPSAGRDQSRLDQLEQQNAQLRGQVAAQAQDKASTARLAALQLAADRGNYRIVPARVTALGADSGFEWTATLDVGTSSGVRVDQTVTDGADLIGRVLQADSASSVVLLAADPGSGVGARDVRTGELGVATGAGTAGFTFVPLDPAATVRPGDRLESGPAGVSSFVSGLALGTVTGVRTAGSGISTATVAAATSPTALDLVGVILVGGQAPARSALQPGSAAQAASGGGH